MNKNTQNDNVYRSCPEVEYFSVHIMTDVDPYYKFISPCCYRGEGHPLVEITDDFDHTVKNYLKLRNKMIEESKEAYQSGIDDNRKYTRICMHCQSYVVKEWYQNDKATYVNLTINPGPCQSKCIYCYDKKYHNKSFCDSDRVQEIYNYAINFVDYMKKNDLISDTAIWQPCTGEISIQPYKDDILKVIGNSTVWFLSNCFVFDQSMAECLQRNKHSVINLSIDSGTATTWKKIKGFNNFNTVINNLRRYRQYCDQENYQQIQLKYIILPGINTRMKDYLGVIEIMKDLNVKSLIISRNIRPIKPYTTDEWDMIVDNVVTLATLCVKNGLMYEFHNMAFDENQIKYINDQVNQKCGKDDISYE